MTQLNINNLKTFTLLENNLFNINLYYKNFQFKNSNNKYEIDTFKYIKQCDNAFNCQNIYKNISINIFILNFNNTNINKLYICGSSGYFIKNCDVEQRLLVITSNIYNFEINLNNKKNVI